MSGENVETVRRMIELANRGDVEGIVALMAPDIECVPAADQPESEPFRGRDAFAAYAKGWLDAFDRYEIEPHEYVNLGSTSSWSVESQPAAAAAVPELQTMKRGSTASGMDWSLSIENAGPGHKPSRRSAALSSDDTRLPTHLPSRREAPVGIGAARAPAVRGWESSARPGGGRRTGRDRDATRWDVLRTASGTLLPDPISPGS